MEQPGLAEELLAALRAIVDYRLEPFDHPPEEWAKHTPATCKDCAEWRERKHPIQHSCEGWYRLMYSREDRRKFDERAQHYHLRQIAREAIDKATGVRFAEPPRA